MTDHTEIAVIKGSSTCHEPGYCGVVKISADDDLDNLWHDFHFSRGTKFSKYPSEFVGWLLDSGKASLANLPQGKSFNVP